MTPTLWRRKDRTHPVTDKAPIYLRIEIAGFDRIEYKTSVKATNDEWSPPHQRKQPVKGQSKEETESLKEDNKKLAKLLVSVHQLYDNMKSQGYDPSPREIRDLLTGPTQQVFSIVDALEMRYAVASQRQAKPTTLLRIRSCIRSLDLFLRETGKGKLPARKADNVFFREFEKWLLAIPLSGASIRSYMGDVFFALKHATEEGKIPEVNRPAYTFISKVNKPEKRHLSVTEVERMAQAQWEVDTLRRVCRLFVFCCYTGLAFADYCRFAAEPEAFIVYVPDPHDPTKLVKGFNMKRQKMIYLDQEHWVPLFQQADELLGELPVYHAAYVNRVLKKIAEVLRLSLLDLSHKDARSTFAQHMRDRYNKSVAAKLGMHTEEIAQKHYSSESALSLLKELSVLGAPLTHN